MTVVTAEVRFNVWCRDCGDVFTPAIKSSLWWKAKKREEGGFMDALTVTGRECGCVRPIAEPLATYRVRGYDDLMRDFDIPFKKFTDAVKEAIKAQKEGCITYIIGVSDVVKKKIECIY